MSALSLAEAHAQALDATREYVAGIKADQWNDPTPCTEWNVRDVVNHIVNENLWVGELMAGKTIEQVGDRFDGDMLGNDPIDAYEKSSKIASDAFFADGAMDVPVAVSYGPIPGKDFCEHRFIDAVVHGWDIASATGQDTNIDPEIVELVLAVVEPHASELQASGYFGTRWDIPPDADSQTKLLALLGRRP